MLGLDKGPGERAATELLVSFTPGASATVKSAALSAVGAMPVETIRTQAMEAAGAGDLVRVTIGKGLSPERAMEIISKRPGVEFAEPNFQYSASFLSDDAFYTNGSLWGMYGGQPSPYDNQYGSHAAAVWGSAKNYIGSTKLGVGVIDTGIDYKHPDLYKNIWLNQTEIPSALRSKLVDVDRDGLITFRDLNVSSNYPFVTDHNGNKCIDADDLLRDTRWIDRKDGNGISVNKGGTANGYTDDLVGWNFVHNNNKPFDDNKHGTHVAGTIGAYSDPYSGPDMGVAGVNWNSQLVALKYLDSSGSGYTSNAVKAIDYFTNLSAAYKNLSPKVSFDFAVTNNSWGGGGFSQSLLDAIIRGAKGADRTPKTADDVLFVAAAGNGGSDRVGDNNDTTPNWPSNYNTTSGAGYDAVVAVAAIDQYGNLAPWSNFGATTVDLAAPGVGIWSTVPNGGWASFNGTSMATPHVAGAIALYSAYDPNASAALVRDRLFESASRMYTNDLGVFAEYTALDGRTATEGRLNIYSLFSDYNLFA